MSQSPSRSLLIQDGWDGTGEWHSLQASLRKEREEKAKLKSEIERLKQQLKQQVETLKRNEQEMTALPKVYRYEIQR